jgi:hypothetical protein
MANAPLFTSWINDPDTGQPLIVEHDREYLDLLCAFDDRRCKHSETEVRRVKLSNGHCQVRDCCTSCGSAIGTAKRQNDKAWVTQLPWADAELVDSYEIKRAVEKEALILQLARKQYAERGRFTKAYEEYLTSDAWKAKRVLVLKRCGGLCEGCGVARATEVHHTTYEHLYNEFLFELLGLCHSCHDRISRERRAAMGIEDDNRAFYPTAACP